MKIKKSIISLLMSNLILSSSAIAGHHTEEGFFIRDANGDGVVSKGEYLVSTEKKFKKMDSNSDGEIDRTEYENSMNRWKKKHKKHHSDDKSHDHK